MAECISSEKLGLFLNDQLDVTTVESITTHLNECRQCRAEMDGLTDLVEYQWSQLSDLPEDADSLDQQIAGLVQQPPLLVCQESEPQLTDLSYLEPSTFEEDMGQLLHYRIKCILGSGGMGVVFEGRDTILERDVAVKVFRPGDESQEKRQRFLREARAVAGLRNDHIVPIFSIHSDNVPRPFMVMELIEGFSLEQVLKTNNDSSPAQIARIGLQVAQGLAAAHQAGVIHRDIKPSNILLDESTQRARITDFGLARLGEQGEKITQDGTLLGTVAYMSPEQIWNSDAVDCRSDIYSLGVTLREMLAGQMPFRGSLHNIMHQIRNDDPVPLRDINSAVPRDLETIVAKCMEKQPQRRYQNADELSGDLRRFLNGEPIEARPVSRPEQVWRWCRRRPLPALLIGLIVFLAIAGPLAAVYQATLRTQIRQMVAEDHYELARLEASRGKWREARKRFELAAEVGHPDPVRVKIESVKALIALGDLESATTELDQLSRSDESSDHLGRVRLLEGDLMLMRGSSEGIGLVEEALKHPLDPADKTYAQSLLAKTPEDSLAFLNETLEHDPFHYQGTGMAVTTLIQLGRLDEALYRARVRELLYPDDPNFPLLQAVIHAIKKDLPTAKLRLKKSASQLKEWQVASLERSIENLHEFVDIMDFWELRNEFSQRATRLLRTIHSELGSGKDSRNDKSGQEPRFVSAALLRLPPIFTQQNSAFQAALDNWTAGRGEEAIAGIEELLGNGAETGEIHFTHGMFLMISHNNRPERFLAAENAFLNAARSQSFWPNVDRESYYTAAMCAGGVWAAELRSGQQGNTDHLKRGVVHAKKRMEMGPLQSAHAKGLYGLAFEAKDWGLCHQILNDVGPRSPNNPLWKRLASKLHLVDGDYYTAWKLATEVLDDLPDEKMDSSDGKFVREVQRNALAKLRESVKQAESTNQQ